MLEIKQNIINNFIYNTTDGGNNNYHINPKTVYDFFVNGNSKIRQIPKYQRPYSWDKKNLIDFLKDILEVSDINNNSKQTWFLGSIYTTQQQTTQNVSSILDGQQRLTSLQIILNEIKLSRFYDDSFELNGSGDIDIEEDINECLFFKDSGKKYTRFKTDNVTNEFIENYLTDSRNISSFNDYKKFYEKFISDLDKHSDESKSINTLYSNIKITKKFINDYVLHNDELIGPKGEKLKPIEKLENFTKSILYHFWLIEIPLIEEKVSTHIFEGLNNRGKPLSLIDKLQFISLTSDLNNEEKIRKSWGQLYQLIDQLNSSNKKQIFKSDEDFIKSLFLSLKGKELDDDSDYIDFFKENYLKDFKSLENFFKKNISTLNFFIQLNSDKGIFLNFFEKEEKEKVKSILYVLRELISQYKNTTILLLYVLDKSSLEQTNKYVIIQCIWSIIQLSAIENIFDGKKGPNKIRDSFLSLNRSAKGQLRNHQNLIHFIKDKNAELENNDGEREFYDLSCIRIIDKKKSFKYARPLNDSSGLLNTNKNEDASIVLYLYILLTQHKKLHVYSTKEMESSHLEHIFPRAWQSAWDNKQYKTNEVVDYLKSKNAEDLIGLVSSDEIDFELKKYNSQPYKQNESLIEWIGNKLILNGQKNQGASNKSYNVKYSEYYIKHDKVMLPSNDMGDLDFNINTDFDYKNIIDRSIIISEKLSNDFLNIRWDEI